MAGFYASHPFSEGEVDGGEHRYVLDLADGQIVVPPFFKEIRAL